MQWLSLGVDFLLKKKGDREGFLLNAVKQQFNFSARAMVVGSPASMEGINNASGIWSGSG